VLISTGQIDTLSGRGGEAFPFRKVYRPQERYKSLKITLRASFFLRLARSWLQMVQNRPINNSTSSTTRTMPKPPLG
jgi:hypothetical protein